MLRQTEIQCFWALREHGACTWHDLIGGEFVKTHNRPTVLNALARLVSFGLAERIPGANPRLPSRWMLLPDAEIDGDMPIIKDDPIETRRIDHQAGDIPTELLQYMGLSGLVHQMTRGA